jgi:hypothetical protein
MTIPSWLKNFPNAVVTELTEDQARAHISKSYLVVEIQDDKEDMGNGLRDREADRGGG